MRVLYIEDDPDARAFLEVGLKSQGVVTEVAPDADAGLALARAGDYDVLILDVMLPDREGFDVLRELRAAGVETPALFLTARSAVRDRVRGLDLGADDYLAKPFALSELVARLRAIARRRGVETAACLKLADLEMDVAHHRVTRAGRPVELTPKQFSLLELLLRNAGRVVSRDTILCRVWGPQAEHRSNALEVQINYLRKKIDHGFDGALIHTRPGLGYVLEQRANDARERAKRERS